MKDHPLYPIYKTYIRYRNISEGAKNMYLISEFSFQNFQEEYERNYRFKKKIDRLHLPVIRDKKISSIIDETD